jgi:hypothetical protein
LTEDTRVYGPESWRNVAGEDWTRWDLWCCVIAAKDHDGDLGRLAASIAAKIRDNRGRTKLYSRDSDDARLAHVVDLDQRLTEADICCGDLAGPEILADRKIGSRARAKFKANVPTGAYARLDR